MYRPDIKTNFSQDIKYNYAQHEEHDLQQAELDEFYKIANLLGHDVNRIKRGDEVRTTFTCSSFKQASNIMTRANAAQRHERSKTFFDNITARQRLPQGVHDRIEASCFASIAISAKDEQRLKHALPLPVMAISILRKELESGETWDVSARGDVWRHHDLIDIYVIVNVGTLVLKGGSNVVSRGNVFSMLCQKFKSDRQEIKIRNVAQSDLLGFDIGILPTPFDMGQEESGSNGKNGKPGKNGIYDHEIKVGHGILGKYLLEEIQEEEINKDGANGGNGSDGKRGANGGVCKVAELTFRNLESDLVVFSQAGKGKNGGDGGDGGIGGDGGTGRNGHKTLTKVIAYTKGGKGGDGGDGGNAGHGGSGGISSNIYINVPDKDIEKVTRIAKPSQPGKAGKGGALGLRGKGGINGVGPSKMYDSKEIDGSNGTAGKDGRDGKSRPPACIFLNEKN